ncbi:MAG: VWA domain-containing protein, partial [Gammaproteobacteria bacterium]
PSTIGGGIDFTAIVTASIEDFDGDSVTNTLTDLGAAAGSFVIKVENDIPTATPVTNSGQAVEAVDTNLVLILDVSGSMGASAGFQGLTRLEVMIQSSLELLEQYDAFGNVKVNLTTFSDFADPSSGWVDVATAKGLILGLSAGGFTNYDDAINNAWASFADDGSSTKIPGGQNISYFLSDGNPNRSALSGTAQDPSLGSGNGIDGAEEPAWEGFLTANNIKSYALGMGTGVTIANLEPIAYDGTVPAEIPAIEVDNFAELEATLVSTVEAPPISGEILGGGGSGKAAIVGADESGWLQSFTVDPGGPNEVVYSYDRVTDTASVSGTSAGTFDAGTNTWTVTTAALATFVVVMDTGAYMYTPPSPLPAAYTEELGYTVIDYDGDTASSTATFTIDPAAGNAVVRDDFVITNQNPVDIPDAALLANDTPENGSGQVLTGVSNPVDGSIMDNTDGTVTFNDTDADGSGSFDYTNTSGGGSDTATVDVTVVSGNILNGDFLDEVLIGGSVGEELNGGAGDDVLVGGGGNDTLSGGNSSLATGDDGADTFLWMNGDTGTDTVTDFFLSDSDPDTPDDVLNIADLLNDGGALDGLDDAALTAALDGQYVSIAAGTDTVVSIFSNGIGGTPDQVIELTGFSTTGSSADIISSLLAGDNLVVE